jgi:protein gp37
LTRTDVLNTHAMKIFEIYNTDENIGPAPASACSRPAKDLPASWISSCKSQGKRKRTGNRSEKVGGKTMKVSGKRIKGRKYGGPLPDYSK